MIDIREIAAKCLKDESDALLGMIPMLGEDFERAINLLLECKGHVVVSGVGKSGHIGAKIAATLASTGTPAFYVNPLDALHGDLGMIMQDDVCLLISNSGSSDEILHILACLEERKVPVVSMTGNPESLLARHSDCHINVSVKREACPLGLAPTSSTTAALAMGDAIACVLMELRNFKANDFAKFHPAGTLGKKLVTRVKDVMYTENLPIIPPDMKLIDAIINISNGKLGLGVVMEGDELLGIITDGDIRRAVERSKRSNGDFLSLSVADSMTKNPKTIGPDAKLLQIQSMFHRNKIHSLLVVDKDYHLLGIVDYFAIMN
ncbi:MAG: KpsF/GutQ family sugar-phosphate isomerase [Bacteroidaceae bacterium]|nr:KpsF/GutQ family sugar-phosphate isomerase [Bacteroidaceae bacterium]